MFYLHRFGRLIVQVRRTLHRSIQSTSDLTCKQLVDVIADYLGGALDPDTTSAFEAHLRSCDSCVAFLNTYKHTIAAVRSLRYEDIPTEMEERVRAFLEIRARHFEDNRRPPAGASQSFIGRLSALLRHVTRDLKHTRLILVPLLVEWVC